MNIRRLIAVYFIDAWWAARRGDTVRSHALLQSALAMSVHVPRPS